MYQQYLIERMKEKKPIPRMVEVTDGEFDAWREATLLADLSDQDVDNPYMARVGDSNYVCGWRQMREIEEEKVESPLPFDEWMDACFISIPILGAKSAKKAYKKYLELFAERM